MNPLLLYALFSFAPSLISKLFGGNPQEKLRQQVAALQSPANLARLKAQYLQQILSGPAYQGALGTIASGGNATTANLAREVGATGITGSGTGAIMRSVGPSIVGGQRAGLLTQADTSAQSSAQDNITKAIQTLLGTQGPSHTQQLFGAGLDSFGPMFQAWLKAKYPTMFNFSPAPVK
jgi:hypothetical protein